MKFVLNKCYGGFSLPEFAVKELGLNSMWDEIERDDIRLIELVEKNPDEFINRISKLKIVEIPDTATDWRIDRYDGIETVTFVVDGKIHSV